MPRNHNRLGRQLDREVYAAVQSYIASTPDHELDTGGATVQQILQYIKRSNSALARRPKAPLEDSIERVVDTLREDQNEYSEEEASRAMELASSGDAMNRHMTRAWNLGSEEQKDAAVTAAPLANGEARKRTGPPSSENGTQQHARASRKRQKAASQAPNDQNTDPLTPPTHVSFEDLGGMDQVISRLEELILLPLCSPDHYISRGLKMPHGILFHGPPGCGKTLLCEAIAAEMQVPFLSISAPSIVSGMSGESEKALRAHFKRAVDAAPCIMFIDEIDAVTPKRESAQREMERRIVAQLLTCMDDLDISKTGGKPVIVLAATNRPDSLDPSLRRAGRFDAEVNIGVPDARVRAQILRVQTRKTKLAEDVDFDALASSTPGFVGADLESLVYGAGNVSNKRYLAQLKELSERTAGPEVQALGTREQRLTGPVDAANISDEPAADIEMLDSTVARPPSTTSHHTPDLITSSHVGKANESKASSQIRPSILSFRRVRRTLMSADTHTLPSDAITHADFLTALPKVQPSSLREGFATVPTVSFASIGALHDHRKALRSAIISPIRNPALYARFKLSHPAGVLLYGPPGCGKTLLARAVANESGANFISVKGPELMNKYVGESERAVRTLFQRARHSQPVIVFFDELDALVPRRGGGAQGEEGGSAISEASSRVVNTLLVELDGAAREGGTNGVYVIAASNRPDAIDPAMLRSGRLGKHLFVGLPSASERGEIMETVLKGLPVVAGQVAEFKDFAMSERCRRFSGADLAVLAQEGSRNAVERGSEWLEMEDMEMAIKVGGVKASVDEAERIRWETLQL